MEVFMYSEYAMNMIKMDTLKRIIRQSNNVISTVAQIKDKTQFAWSRSREITLRDFTRKVNGRLVTTRVMCRVTTLNC